MPFTASRSGSDLYGRPSMIFSASFGPTRGRVWRTSEVAVLTFTLTFGSSFPWIVSNVAKSVRPRRISETKNRLRFVRTLEAFAFMAWRFFVVG